MAMKFMSGMKKMQKAGQAVGDMQAAKKGKGDYAKRVSSRKAKSSLMKMFK